jgi:hypothetical protein
MSYAGLEALAGESCPDLPAKASSPAFPFSYFRDYHYLCNTTDHLVDSVPISLSNFNCTTNPPSEQIFLPP